MERRLRMIDESTDVTQLLGENLKKVEMLKQALQNEHDPDARLTLFRNLASQLVFANKNEEAIRAYSEIEDLEKRGGSRLTIGSAQWRWRLHTFVSANRRTVSSATPAN